jgi:membrane protein implicated in regulation of membrane protease activity
MEDMMTQDEKLERLKIIIGIREKMKRTMFWYMVIALCMFFWFVSQYDNSTPIQLIVLCAFGVLVLVFVYSYYESRKLLDSTNKKYQEVEAGDTNGEY